VEVREQNRSNAPGDGSCLEPCNVEARVGLEPGPSASVGPDTEGGAMSDKDPPQRETVRPARRGASTSQTGVLGARAAFPSDFLLCCVLSCELRPQVQETLSEAEPLFNGSVSVGTFLWSLRQPFQVLTAGVSVE
jgi:hypothetical protein